MNNEAAERLRKLHRDALVGWDSKVLDGMNKVLDKALAAAEMKGWNAHIDRMRESGHGEDCDPQEVRRAVEAECVARGHLTAADLQAERRATVERIRERYMAGTVPGFRDGIALTILDEEAAR